MALPKKLFDTQIQLVDAVKNNETLQNIARQFIQIAARFHIYHFYEGRPTFLKGSLRFVVDQKPVSPDIKDFESANIQQDHSHMCKFESDSAPGFELVAEGIQRYASDAPNIILSRWAYEKEASLVEKTAAVQEPIPSINKVAAQELMGPSK